MIIFFFIKEKGGTGWGAGRGFRRFPFPIWGGTRDKILFVPRSPASHVDDLASKIFPTPFRVFVQLNVFFQGVFVMRNCRHGAPPYSPGSSPARGATHRWHQ